MNLSRNATVLIAAGILALGIAEAGSCIEDGIKAFSNRDRVVTVRGLCEREVQANKVTWPIVLKENGNDLPSIYSQLESRTSEVVAFLKANGIADSEVTIAAPEVTDALASEYANEDRRSRYYVTSVVVVTSSKVQKVSELISRQSELLKRGIAIVANDYNYRTQYEYTDLNKIKPEMIAEATANAREAAVKFAEDSGSDIGKISSAQQGQFSIEDRDNFTPQIKTVRVVTTLTYYIDE
jgi:hypothetical protein